MAGIFVSTVNEIACWKPLKLIADNSLLKYYIVTDKQGPICASRVQFGALYFIRWFVYEICKTYCDLSGRNCFRCPGSCIFRQFQSGVSPVNSLPYVVSRILGKDLGTCVTVIFIGYILIQILLLRKAFRPLDLAQILCSFAFGYFVDLTETLLGSFCLPGYPGRLVMLAISIFLVAFGICYIWTPT